MLAQAPPLLVLAGAVVAGFVQGLSGFAVGLVAMAFWSYQLEPQVIAPLVVLCSTAGQILTIRTVLPSLNLRLAMPMLLGGMAGVPVGIALLPHVDAAGLQLGTGLLLSLYCPAMLLSRQLPRIRWGGRWADAGAGVLGGVMGGVAGLGGPAPTLWCTLRGWERDTQRAVFQSFLIVAQLATLAGYLLTGAITPRVLELSTWILPCVLLPSLLGARLYTFFSDDAFRRLVLVLLFASGLALLAHAVPALLAAPPVTH